MQVILYKLVNNAINTDYIMVNDFLSFYGNVLYTYKYILTLCGLPGIWGGRRRMDLLDVTPTWNIPQK